MLTKSVMNTSSMRTLVQSTTIAPTEPQELLVMEWEQDCDTEITPSIKTHAIPILGIRINIYEQRYKNSDGVDLITEIQYISASGEVNIDGFSTIQVVSPSNSLAHHSVVVLRTKGSDQVCLLQPQSSKSWLANCPHTPAHNLYAAHSSEEAHPVLVDLDKLKLEISGTFSVLTNSCQANQRRAA